MAGASGRERIIDFPPEAAPAAFPRRARSGGFRSLPHADAERLIADRLRDFGFDPGWQGAVSRLVAEAAEAELFPEAGFRLNRLPRRPVGRGGVLPSARPADPAQAARGVRPLRPRGGAAGLPRAPGAAELAPLQGTWRGSSTWYAFHRDASTSSTGNPTAWRSRPTTGPSGSAVMQDELYLLQHYIYTLRWTSTSAPPPGYDYARDFGGVAYVFLRGLDRAAGPGPAPPRPAGPRAGAAPSGGP